VVPMLSWKPDADLTGQDPHSVFYWVGMARKP
jgi:hypothetical protein